MIHIRDGVRAAVILSGVGVFLAGCSTSGPAATSTSQTQKASASASERLEEPTTMRQLAQLPTSSAASASATTTENRVKARLDPIIKPHALTRIAEPPTHMLCSGDDIDSSAATNLSSQGILSNGLPPESTWPRAYDAVSKELAKVGATQTTRPVDRPGKHEVDFFGPHGAHYVLIWGTSAVGFYAQTGCRRLH